MSKIPRKFMVHYINATPRKEKATYQRLGKDLGELTVELSAEVEKKNNILGETSVNLGSYEASASVEPYYAEKGDPLFDFLQDIIDNRKVLDDCKTDILEVHTWEDDEDGAYVTYQEDVVIEPVSYGGDTTGYQIPFNIHYCGNRRKVKFNPTTKEIVA